MGRDPLDFTPAPRRGDRYSGHHDGNANKTPMTSERRPRHKILLLTLSALLAGSCALPALNLERDQATLQPNMALLVGSVTQSSDGKPSPFHDRAIFHFGEKTGNIRFHLDSAEIERPILGPPNRALTDRGLEDVNGKLFAVQLPPGTYQLERFLIEGTKQRIAFSRPLGVELSAGEIAYIGNLDAAFCVRHAYANQAGVAGVVISVNDRRDRDIRLLRERFAALRRASIGDKVLDNSLLQPQAAPLARQCSCWKNC